MIPLFPSLPETPPPDARALRGLRRVGWFDAKDRELLFPFGYGLSYTKFALSDLRAARHGAEAVTVSVKVQNTGARAGAEVVQVYVDPPAGEYVLQAGDSSRDLPL